MCAELCAEIRYEYRLFLANLCLSVHREDLIPWCFEYAPGPPPVTLLPSSWEWDDHVSHYPAAHCR